LDFEPKKAFGLIDVDDDGFVDAVELLTFLLKYKINVDIKEA